MASDIQNSSSYTPIQCQIYDYIEIACMHHYQLDIELNIGEVVRGKAKTTQIINKQEFIVISLKSELDVSSKENEDSEKNAIQSSLQNSIQDNEQTIRLDLIKSITALDKNAKFGTVIIN